VIIVEKVCFLLKSVFKIQIHSTVSPSSAENSRNGYSELMNFEYGPLLEPNLDDCEENVELLQFHIS